MIYEIAVFPSLRVSALLAINIHGYLHSYAMVNYEAAQLHRPHISQLGSLRLLKLKVSTRETATSVTHHRRTSIRQTYAQHHPIATDKAIHHNLRLFFTRRITNPQTVLSTRDSSTHLTATSAKPLHTRTAKSATMSDAEDDYMSMSFADPPPPTNPKTSLQRHQER